MFSFPKRPDWLWSPYSPPLQWVPAFVPGNTVAGPWSWPVTSILCRTYQWVELHLCCPHTSSWLGQEQLSLNFTSLYLRYLDKFGSGEIPESCLKFSHISRVVSAQMGLENLTLLGCYAASCGSSSTDHVMTLKSAVLSYFAAENWNHTNGHWLVLHTKLTYLLSQLLGRFAVILSQTDWNYGNNLASFDQRNVCFAAVLQMKITWQWSFLRLLFSQYNVDGLNCLGIYCFTRQTFLLGPETSVLDSSGSCVYQRGRTNISRCINKRRDQCVYNVKQTKSVGKQSHRNYPTVRL
jgi:hypothetical protein